MEKAGKVCRREVLVPGELLPQPAGPLPGKHHGTITKVLPGVEGGPALASIKMTDFRKLHITVPLEKVLNHLVPKKERPRKPREMRFEAKGAGTPAAKPAAPKKRKRPPGAPALRGPELLERLKALEGVVSAKYPPGTRLWVRVPGSGRSPGVSWSFGLVKRRDMGALVASYREGKGLVLVRFYGEHSQMWVHEEDCEPPPEDEAELMRQFKSWGRAHNKQRLVELALDEVVGAHGEPDKELRRMAMLYDQYLQQRQALDNCYLCREMGARLECGVCDRLFHPLCLREPAVSEEEILDGCAGRWDCPCCGEENVLGEEREESEGEEGEKQQERMGLTPDWLIEAAAFHVFALERPHARRPYIPKLLDPCTNSKLAPNIPAEKLYDKRDNGLKLSNSWEGFYVLCNPDFRAQVQWRFVNRCVDEVENGAVPATILICRNSTDTAYFQRLRNYPRVMLRRTSARFKDYEKTAIGFGIAVFCIAKRDCRELYERFYDAFESMGEPSVPVDKIFVQSEEYLRLLERLKTYAAQHHRDHWVQCSRCEKWRIVDYQAAMEIGEEEEWTCALLRPPYTSCDTPLSKGEMQGGRYAAHGADFLDMELQEQEQEPEEEGAGAGEVEDLLEGAGQAALGEGREEEGGSQPRRAAGGQPAAAEPAGCRPGDPDGGSSRAGQAPSSPAAAAAAAPPIQLLPGSPAWRLLPGAPLFQGRPGMVLPPGAPRFPWPLPAALLSALAAARPDGRPLLPGQRPPGMAAAAGPSGVPLPRLVLPPGLPLGPLLGVPRPGQPLLPLPAQAAGMQTASGSSGGAGPPFPLPGLNLPLGALAPFLPFPPTPTSGARPAAGPLLSGTASTSTQASRSPPAGGGVPGPLTPMHAAQAAIHVALTARAGAVGVVQAEAAAGGTAGLQLQQEGPGDGAGAQAAIGPLSPPAWQKAAGGAGNIDEAGGGNEAAPAILHSQQRHAAEAGLPGGGVVPGTAPGATPGSATADAGLQQDAKMLDAGAVEGDGCNSVKQEAAVPRAPVAPVPGPPLPPAIEVVCERTLRELITLPPRNITLDREEGGEAGQKVLTALELARQARIAANRAYLAGLGLGPHAVHRGGVQPLAPDDPVMLQAARELAMQAAAEEARRQLARMRDRYEASRRRRARLEPILLKQLRQLAEEEAEAAQELAAAEAAATELAPESEKEEEAAAGEGKSDPCWAQQPRQQLQNSTVCE